MKTKRTILFFIVLSLAMVVWGCTPQSPIPASQAGENSGGAGLKVTFTLETTIADGKMVYVGSGGNIDGMINPDLTATSGDTIEIVLINGDGMPHDLAIPEVGIQTAMVTGEGRSAEATGSVQSGGKYNYFCTVAGHRQAGMEGRLIVSEP